MPVDIAGNPIFTRRLHKADLRRIADKTLRLEKAAGRTISIVVVGNRQIRSYNRRFHHVNAPTDVLSFRSDEKRYLGDIIISYQIAKANARKAGWKTSDELCLLVVHGILHLLGYDDTTPRAKRKMWKRQREILGRAIPE